MLQVLNTLDTLFTLVLCQWIVCAKIQVHLIFHATTALNMTSLLRGKGQGARSVCLTRCFHLFQIIEIKL